MKSLHLHVTLTVTLAYLVLQSTPTHVNEGKWYSEVAPLTKFVIYI